MCEKKADYSSFSVQRLPNGHRLTASRNFGKRKQFRRETATSLWPEQKQATIRNPSIDQLSSNKYTEDQFLLKHLKNIQEYQENEKSWIKSVSTQKKLPATVSVLADFHSNFMVPEYFVV